MKIDRIVILLGIYVFAMGVWGMARSGSLTPVLISGGIAAVTVWLGWMMGRGIRSARLVTIAWLILVGTVLVLATFGGIANHPTPGTISMFIFGSMALFAVGNADLDCPDAATAVVGSDSPNTTSITSHGISHEKRISVFALLLTAADWPSGYIDAG